MVGILWEWAFWMIWYHRQALGCDFNHRTNTNHQYTLISTSLSSNTFRGLLSSGQNSSLSPLQKHHGRKTRGGQIPSVMGIAKPTLLFAKHSRMVWQFSSQKMSVSHVTKRMGTGLRKLTNECKGKVFLSSLCCGIQALYEWHIHCFLSRLSLTHSDFSLVNCGTFCLFLCVKQHYV